VRVLFLCILVVLEQFPFESNSGSHWHSVHTEPVNASVLHVAVVRLNSQFHLLVGVMIHLQMKNVSNKSRNKFEEPLNSV
jgi:hypothetical protein